MLHLSILTPAVPSRLEQLGKLCAELARQIGDLPVEHLVLLDNKRRTVGEKRDALLRAARGQYIAFVDDDDWIAPAYISSLHSAICDPQSEIPPDVVTFDQLATVNGVTAEIAFRLKGENDAFQSGTIQRAAWHVCAWRRSLAILSHFPATNYGEDWAFAAPLNQIAKTEHHIPQSLHFYRHATESTEAPPPI